MALLDDLIAKLNEEQKLPVLDTEGQVLVIAGAGSGKTRVLTTRIANIVATGKAEPYEIMAITFTNKASNEMRERLIKIIGNIGDMWVSTIHSMCVRILRSDIDKIGYERNFTIYDDTDKEKVLKRVLERLGYENGDILRTAKNYISSAKNDGLDPEQFLREYAHVKLCEKVYQIYVEDEKVMAHSNALDFDDLLVKTYELLRSDANVLNYYANRFKYIHIDEFQDTNKVQFDIVKMLASKHLNLFVVGDDDQSIYGWRGAKIENILSFDATYPQAKVYKLQKNYRSTKKILDLANCIIKNNSSRREKELYTDNSDGVKIETFVGSDENNEASYAAIQIKSLMARNNYDYKDFAIFIRINALSRPFEQELTKYGIPYRIFGGFRFFERKEIKDILAYLKVINNSYDDESFLRCISSPRRGIGEKTLVQLCEFCASVGVSLYDGISMIDNSAISNAAKVKLKGFRSLLDSFKEFSLQFPVSELLRRIIEKTAFKEQFSSDTEEDESKLYNVDELLNSAYQFERDNVGSDLADYLNSVTLATDTDNIDQDNVVTVATIHAVKGLEFRCVFIAGLDERIMPIQRSSSDITEMEEERRLMYVAITRAKERLYLTRASSRFIYGGRAAMAPSRFLKEARPSLYPNSNSEFNRKTETYSRDYNYHYYNDVEDFPIESSGGGYSSGYARSFIDKSSLKENKNVNYSVYERGKNVKHVKFGIGTVIDVKGVGENTIVDVAFKGYGIKSLSVKYAPMELIDG